jgi:phage terminase small subunit
MTKSTKALSELQQSFVLNYVKNGFNAYQAARSAGYTEASATVYSHKILDNPIVKSRVEAAFKRFDKRIDVAFDWRIDKLKRIINAVIPDNEDTVKLKDAKVAISAIAELNKMYGDYAPDKRLSVTVDATKEKLVDARKQYEEF